MTNTRFDVSVLRQPRWISVIVLSLVLAGIFVYLGTWQLDRLAQRQERNATIVERTDQPARSLGALRSEFSNDPDELAFRHTFATGTYRPDDEFFSIGRVYGGAKGTLVATPLDLEDGSVLIVIRGIVPGQTEGPPAVGYRVPTVPVVVQGRVAEGEAPLRIGEPDPPRGHIESLSRLDLEFIDTWIEGDVLPFMLLLDNQIPESEAAPIAIPNEELTEGSHLGYAVQWFAFAVIAIGGLGPLLYRAGRVESDETA
ncbi:MAG: SURF1 family protein [Acidimicrobiia bacterium]|nr:SURF1 family protein [Acidimicrobiia bacterium]